MRDERAVGVLAEGERQAVERLRRAVPRELVGQPAHARLEFGFARTQHERVDAVGADDQVGLPELGERVHPAAEVRRHARRSALRLQQLVEPEPRDGREAVAVDIDALVVVHDALHRPAFHAQHERAMQCGRVALEKSERPLREHHAETEGRVRGVLLEDLDGPRGEPALDEQRKQQPRGPGSEDGDAHVRNVE